VRCARYLRERQFTREVVVYVICCQPERAFGEAAFAPGPSLRAVSKRRVVPQEMYSKHIGQRLGEEFASEAPALNLREQRESDALYLRVGGAEERHDFDLFVIGARFGGHPPNEAVFEEHAHILGCRVRTPVAWRTRWHDSNIVRGYKPLVRPLCRCTRRCGPLRCRLITVPLKGRVSISPGTN
jgi:hypothetical protein